MKKIDSLKREAKHESELRGHLLDRFTTKNYRSPTNGIVRTAIGKCIRCKKILVCVDNPIDGEPNITGEAYDVNCRYGSVKEPFLESLILKQRHDQVVEQEKDTKNQHIRLNKKYGLRSEDVDV